MNRYAPPATDVLASLPSHQLGKAGWLAAAATLVHLSTIAVGYPEIAEFALSRPVAVFFVYIGSATGLFLILGTLLLLARFPSSMLFFMAALGTALLEFRSYFVLLPIVGVAAALLCLAASVTVFLARGPRSSRVRQ